MATKLRTQYWVIDEHGLWSVRRGRNEWIAYFGSRDAAIARACREARTHVPSQVRVERADGKIDEEHFFDAAHRGFTGNGPRRKPAHPDGHEPR